jgi:carbon starvation protein CstA
VRALVIITPILCILAITYRYYSLFIARHVMALDDSRVTLAGAVHDYVSLWASTRRGGPVARRHLDLTAS